MPSSYVGRVSADSKQYESTLASQKALPRSSLGLDLRFEQTYLKSIAPYVRSATPASAENKGLADTRRQRLEIKWWMVIWITTRDQVFAPFFQGVIWGNVYPWVQYFRGGFAPSSRDGRPSTTGAGIAKLTSWLSSVIPPTPTASFRTR